MTVPMTGKAAIRPAVFRQLSDADPQSRSRIGRALSPPLRVLLLATSLLSPISAEAQTPVDAPLPSLLIPLEPPEPLPTSGTAGGYLFNLRPLGADFGKTLADRGVYLVARSLSEELGNVSGGVKRGSFFEGFVNLGFDLDMTRIAGIGGGAFHFLVSDLQGQSFSEYSGSAYLNNRVFAGNGPATRLNEFSYEQSLFDKRLDVRVGRVPAYTQFDGSELYCTLVTSLCRTPGAYTFDRGYPPYLAASWAAIVQARLAGPFYTNLAVFENEPVLSEVSHSGFPGRDWDLGYADGVTLPVQFGYRTTVQDDDYPRAFSLGGFYNTARYADPLLNTAGLNRTLFGGPSQMDHGASQIYLQAQQMVYRPDTSDRGLTLFAGANSATSGEPNVARSVFAGAYYKGLVPDRPNDTLSLAITYVGVNPRVTDRIDTVLLATGRGQASRSEISYELNYGFRIAPGMSLKPFLEFISHPDQANSPAPSGSNTHALFVGALLEVDAIGLLGLPKLGQ